METIVDVSTNDSICLISGLIYHRVALDESLFYKKKNVFSVKWLGIVWEKQLKKVITMETFLAVTVHFDGGL